MGTWSIRRIELPLKFKWSIARGESEKRENLYITYQDGAFRGSGEVAFMTNRGPSFDDVSNKFKEFLENVPDNINGLEEMMLVLEQESLEDYPNLRFGLESAYIHFLAELLDGDVASVLGINSKQKAQTCFSLPILEKSKYAAFIEQHQLKRFHALKIKIKDSDPSIIETIANCYEGALWIDANECFDNLAVFLGFLAGIKHLKVELIEQPFSKNNFEAFFELKKINNSGIKIIADESLGNGNITQDYKKAFDGVNIKLMKAGGYFKALKQIRDARSLGLQVMLGCMLESSLGIYSAFNICDSVDYIDLDSVLFLQEDPLNLVFEEKGVLQLTNNQ
jgi:L-alanine-DL-glutamate epimerase-like enolase superfamily enzyme